MSSLKPRSLIWFASAFAMLFVLSLTGAAQTDPDPNSPQPILLTGARSPRALASQENGGQDFRGAMEREPQAFYPGSKVVLYAANFEFLPGEGANSVRVNATDAGGRQYRFPVLDVERIKSEDTVFAVTIELRDEIKYWPAPEPGDLLIYLSWRGLSSNSAWLGYGQVGGLKSDEDVVPVPFKQRSKGGVKIPDANAPAPEYVGYRWSGDRMRFLEQATFGPTWALDQEVRRTGIRQYLVQQFNEPYPSANNPYPNFPLKNTDSANATNGCGMFTNPSPEYSACIRDYYTQYQTQNWFMCEAFYSDAQLRHRVAWALSQIWVTSGVDIQQGRHMVEYHKILSANAFGNYRTLMKQMTMNPTMGDYLDMVRSTKNNPNENYARELNQLFTVGLYLLNPDGTLQLDGSNNPIPTYDQNTINNFTKVLTGWNFCNTPGASCPNAAVGLVNYIDPVLLATGNHDLTAKTLFSYPGSTTTNILACAAPCTSVADRTTYANNSMDQALDNIFYHPNLGPYIGKILIQQLVTSDPTPAYVGRVTAAFNNNGSGVRGDMKSVIRAILLDPEACGDVKTDPKYGKLREPVLLTTNFARTFNVRGAGGAGTTSDGYFTGRGEFTGMAQNPFRSPTVFNYYPPSYVVPGTTLLGPEFGIMTTSTSIQRANFMNRMVFTAIPIPIDTNTPNGTSFDFSDLQALIVADTTNNRLLDTLNQKMMHSTMSASMRSTIMTAMNAQAVSNPPTDAQTLARVRAAIYLIATSSQYQVQR